MTRGRARPALASGWSYALKRGAVAFLAMALVGQLVALAEWVLGGTGRSFITFARIGWLYFGTSHHVAVELSGAVTVGSAGVPSRSGSIAISFGVALMAATGLAVWLLWRAGRRVADATGGGTSARVLHGATISLGYAVPALVLSMLVHAQLAVASDAFDGHLRLGLVPWQAFAFPFAIAAAAGGAGGLRSAVEARTSPRLRVVAAAAAGGWRMFWLALALSFAGLFLAGVVQPDDAVALATPSSARYYQEVFERPRLGFLILGHHVALAPNEAVWALVPAMGGCDAVRGTERSAFLCYGRFPLGLQLLGSGELPPVSIDRLRFGWAPAGYLLFLLVPGVATLLGGRAAAARFGGGGAAVSVGIAAAIPYAVLVGCASLLATLSLSYTVTLASDTSTGRVWIGPDPLRGTLLALAWGVVGGALGAATVGRLRSRRAGRGRSRATAR